jgi:serine-type D-Ala-D-Ala carboxypeptidase (penicillin-binding protein 5/6)
MRCLFRKILCGVLLAAWITGAMARPTSAAPANPQPTPNATTAAPTTVITPQPPNINAKAYVLMDANTGEVLAQKNMNDRLPPASLTKLMTAYVASSALKQGQIKLNDMVTVSEKAWKMQGSRMFIQVGTQVSVKDLLDGIIVASGNDACVAMAEHVAGSEDVFVQLMNQNAARLGMQNTNYTDSTGMPDPNHYSTAYDLAVLTRAIVKDYPEDYAWYKNQWIVYNNVRQPNRNRLLWRDSSVDGLKTGHTDSAGYCLVSSALRSHMRLISVVMGEPSDNARTDDSAALLNWGYRFFETHQLFSANQPLEVKMQPRVWFGKYKYAKLGFAQDAYATIPVNQFKQLQAKIDIQPKLQAPVKKGQAYGQVNVTLNGQPLTTIPVVALEDDPKGNIFSRAWDHIAILFVKWLHLANG